MAGLLAAVRADLEAIGSSGSAEAELALSLAGWLEDPETPASARAGMASRLLESLSLLRAGGPVREESPLERIRRERDAGVARIADSQGHAHTRRKRAS